MKEIGFIAWTLFAMYLAALFHERDIEKQIESTGNSGSAAWMCRIVGHVAPKDAR